MLFLRLPLARIRAILSRMSSNNSSPPSQRRNSLIPNARPRSGLKRSILLDQEGQEIISQQCARLRKIAYEKFAQFVASGLSLAESYRRTTGQTKNADVKGTQWHGYAGIKERIAELKEQNAQRAQMTREELMAFYAAVIRTPADQVPAGSPVIQAYEMTESGHKIRIADKIAAGAALSTDVRLEFA